MVWLVMARSRRRRSARLPPAAAAVTLVTLVTVVAGCGAAPPSEPAGAGSGGPTQVGSVSPPSVSATGTPTAQVLTTPPIATAAPTRSASTAPPAGAPARFTTLAPGSTLPSGPQCATWVRANPYPENKGANTGSNRTTGAQIGADFFSGTDPRANSVIARRVDGRFTGTTGQILRWAACKWGIDEDLVFAQAAIESWWLQGTLGDWTTDASRCAPGRGLSVDGRPGECPESFGILQNRYPYEQSAWPGIASSTAMNADLAYAIWRSCFEGYERWLNTVERGSTYVAGDAWGCIGRWFSGRWHTSAGDQYVERVRGYLDQRIWETPDFQQP